MEILDVVDENGEYTGQSLDRNIVHDNSLWHWEIAVFVVNNKKEVLLQKRAATKRFNPGKWGLCAGHVDSGETLENTALRELEEEIGIKFNISDLKVLCDKHPKKDENNYHITRFYYVFCDSNDFKIQESELSEVKWYKIDDVIDMVNNLDDSITIQKDRLFLLEKLREILNK